MRVHVLGPSGLGRRPQVLLAALALGGGVQSADALANAIWGDELPATWGVALRGLVSRLRADLGVRVIDTVAPGYRLGSQVRTDLADAQDAAREAADLLAANRPAAALERAEPVSALSGELLLPGEDAAWLTPHRAGVDALAARALELVVAAAGPAGQPTRAVDAARRAVAADELAEPAYRALITALAAAGDRAGVVRTYEACRARLADQLGVEPSTDTVEAYLAALGDARPGDPARRARPPQFRSSFVGRRDECDALAAALDSPGLVTIAGRGGVGKSRLAHHVSAARAPLWVPLASVTQDALVPAIVALEVGATVGPGDAVDALAAHLAPLGRAVLVLDGCEPAVDGVASLVVELLAAAPDLTVLATSRVPLGVHAERVLSLPALAADDEQLRLLRDRVREAGGRVGDDVETTAHLRTLLARCGGLPLALELVAAQLTAVAPGDLFDHLADVEHLGGPDDDRLRSVTRSSYALLAADEAALFRAFGVLDGAVGVPLARRVGAAVGVAPARVVRILRELSVRGLLTVDREGVRWRYQQDDDLHRFAAELLAERGEREQAFTALADAVRALLPDDARSAPSDFADDVSAVIASVRRLFAAALVGHADATTCLELAFRLHRYFATTAVAEGRFWLDQLLTCTAPGEWTPYAQYALGYLGYWAGDTEDAVRRLTEAVDGFGTTPTPYTARALIYLAGLLDDVDRGAEAADYVNRSIAAAAPFETDLQVGAAMGTACVLGERGDPAGARHAADAIDLCRRDGSPEQLAITLPTAAMVCWQVGDDERARDFVTQAMPLNAQGRRISRAVLLSAAAGLAFGDGDLDGAVDLAVQADRAATDLGVERETPLIRATLARALLARGEGAAAAKAAVNALDAAAGLAYEFPYAVCLETAALVADASGADGAAVAEVLATATALRHRGDRPGVPALTAAVRDLRARVGPARALPVADADAACRAMLTA